MTATRTDDELEQLLRATLSSQADTVTAGPSWARAEVPSRRRWIAPLIAAAVVLGLVATVVALRSQHSATPPATPPAPKSGADFTAFPVPGYPVAGVLFQSGYRAVAVRTPRTHDKNKADAIVFAMGPRGYDFRGFRSQAHITVDGRPGYRGTAPALPNNDGHRVPTIVWNDVPDHWALVQSVEDQPAPPTATLLRIAAVAQPSGHMSVPTPFRFSAVPAGYRPNFVSVTNSGRLINLQFTTRHGGQVVVTELPANGRLASEVPAAPRVVRHDDQLIVIDAFRRNGVAAPGDEAAAAFLRTHLVWEPTTLDHVVP
jgi:hypothetical protein